MNPELGEKKRTRSHVRDFDQSQQSGAAQVGAVFGLDDEFFPGIDEEGYLHGQTGFHDSGFVDVVGGVTFDALWGVGHDHDHRGGQLYGGDVGVGEEEGVSLALDEVVFHRSDQILMHDHVFVGVVVKEMVATGVFVGVFVRDALQQHAVHRIVRGEAEIEYLLRVHAAHGHLHVGSHAWWGLELVADHDADFVVVADGVSFAEIDDGSTGHGGKGCGARYSRHLATAQALFSQHGRAARVVIAAVS